VTVTTSVAETGITIKSLKYVIDCGFNKTGAYSPAYDLGMLVTKNVVRSAVEQRFGRAGRNFYGYAFGLYTEDTYNKLPEYEFADTYSKDMAKPLLDIMYSGIGPKFIRDFLAYEKFSNFRSCCVDPDSAKLSVDNSNCQSIYVRTVVDRAGTHRVDNYHDGVPFEDNPPEMLNALPQDGFIAARAKLLSLGLYGTYAGYIASKMNRVESVEAARMLICCSGYGISLNDAATMAVLGSVRTSYKIDQFTAKRKKLPAWYNRDKISSAVLKKDNLATFFKGNISQFMDLLCCDFVEGLMVLKYMVLIVRRTKRFDTLRDKLAEVGVNYDAIRIIMEERLEIIKSCMKLGLNNTNPDIDFASPNLVSHLAKIKRTLFSGYKNHQIYHESGSRYRSSSGLQLFINVESNDKPKKLLYSELFMREDSASFPYTITANAVTSLDGWI
jgi:hypothetical protein